MGKFFDAIAKSEKEKRLMNKSSMAEANNDEDDLLDLDISDFEISNYDQSIPSNSVGGSNKIDDIIISYHQPQSYEAEQFRILKTGLFFSRKEGAPRTIMISSAEPNEGKSFVASNLAITFAKSMDSHVLLIDCDLRNPTVHKVFGLPGEAPGLSDLLKKKIDIKSALYKTQVDKLTILPGGRIPHNPTELLSSSLMMQLIEEVKSRYNDRYIIIDSPPPLLTAETIAVSSLVDGVIVVVRHEKTSRNTVKKVINMFDKDKILGLVLNKYDARVDKYYGYGKYGDYYNK